MSEQRSTQLRVLPWLVAIGFFMQTLDGTILNTALPAMAKSLGESPLRMQSVRFGRRMRLASMPLRPAGQHHFAAAQLRLLPQVAFPLTGQCASPLRRAARPRRRA